MLDSKHVLLIVKCSCSPLLGFYSMSLKNIPDIFYYNYRAEDRGSFQRFRPTCLQHGVDACSAVGRTRQEQVAMIWRRLDAVYGAIVWIE